MNTILESASRGFFKEKAHCPICKRAVCDGDVEDADGLQRILDQLAILRPLEKADRASEDDGVVSSGVRENASSSHPIRTT